MRLFADENFPRPAVAALRESGADVIWIAETHPGASDDEVLAQCVTTKRTLLTFDKDFGELAYRRGLPADCGIIPFRLTPQNPQEVAALALMAIRSQPSWSGRFSVVTRTKIRIRPLPKARD
jgi:predicted nuclease of predicted toxin-antitoxin system